MAKKKEGSRRKKKEEVIFKNQNSTKKQAWFLKFWIGKKKGKEKKVSLPMGDASETSVQDPPVGNVLQAGRKSLNDPRLDPHADWKSSHRVWQTRIFAKEKEKRVSKLIQKRIEEEDQRKERKGGKGNGNLKCQLDNRNKWWKLAVMPAIEVERWF